MGFNFVDLISHRATQEPSYVLSSSRPSCPPRLAQCHARPCCMCLGEVVMRTILLMVMLLAMAVVAEAQWAYMTPPWNFDSHPNTATRLHSSK